MTIKLQNSITGPRRYRADEISISKRGVEKEEERERTKSESKERSFFITSNASNKNILNNIAIILPTHAERHPAENTLSVHRRVYMCDDEQTDCFFPTCMHFSDSRYRCFKQLTCANLECLPKNNKNIQKYFKVT